MEDYGCHPRHSITGGQGVKVSCFDFVKRKRPQHECPVETFSFLFFPVQFYILPLSDNINNLHNGNKKGGLCM